MCALVGEGVGWVIFGLWAVGFALEHALGCGDEGELGKSMRRGIGLCFVDQRRSVSIHPKRNRCERDLPCSCLILLNFSKQIGTEGRALRSMRGSRGIGKPVLR